MQLKIIREWRIYGKNGQEKAICILQINKLFQSAPFWYYQFYWRPLAFGTFMFSFPIFLQFTWTSKVHFYWLRPSVCVVLLEKWRKKIGAPWEYKTLAILSEFWKRSIFKPYNLIQVSFLKPIAIHRSLAKFINQGFLRSTIYII